MSEEVIFSAVSPDRAFTAFAYDSSKIYLRYEGAKQSAWLNREDAMWLATRIIKWENDPKGQIRDATTSGSFAVVADSGKRLYVHYEILNQGAWIPRGDAEFLADVILEWLSET